MKLSEKVYLADTLVTLNKILGDVYDGSLVEDGLIDKYQNDSLGAMLECLMTRIEEKIDNE